MLLRSMSTLSRIAIALCFVAVISSAHAGEGKPVALPEVDFYDSGKVFEGADVTHAYIIKNTGDADLEIQSVKAG